MRRMLKKMTVVFMTFCMLLGIGAMTPARAYAAQNPTITLKAVSNITKTDAQINVSVNNPSKVKITKVGFILYDKNGKELTDKYDSCSMTGGFTAWFDMNKYYGKLTPGTTYNYVVYVTTSSKTIKSVYGTFSTVADKDPTIALSGVSDISDVDAQLNAKITNPDGVKITKLGFILYDYETGKKLTDKYDSISMTSGFTAWFKMSKYYGSLTPGKKYTYVIYVTTSSKTIESAMGFFTTNSIPAPTSICFPLSTDKVWYASTYAGHGESFGSGYSAVDIIFKDGKSCKGQSVFAVEDGQVIDVNTGNGQVVIKHTKQLVTNNGKVYKTWYSVYAHMYDITVTKGNTVKRGQPIGKVGAVGNATGPHLHFNIISGNDGSAWYCDDKAKAISPYYVSGFVKSSGADQNYCICDREGPAVTSKLKNWAPTGK